MRPPPNCRHATPSAGPVEQPGLPPDKPSIAVLPFQNMSGDPEQEFFADGIAEDVITALSRCPSLFVIARNSCFTYKGRAVDVKLVGREMRVRYVLEGSLRKAGSRIRVAAQLVEAESGKHIWAERYDRDLADIFAVQDEIAEAVTIAIVPAVADAEQQRAIRRPPENLNAWAAYQRGLWHLSKLSAADNALARKFFQQAIDLDPNFAKGYSGLFETLRQAVTLAMPGFTEPEVLSETELQSRVAAAPICGHHRGSTCVIDRLLKNQNPLENGNNLRSSSPLLVMDRRPENRAAILRSEIHGHGSHWLFRLLVFGSGIRRLDGEAVGGRHLARTPPRRVTRWLAASTIAPPGSSALFNRG